MPARGVGSINPYPVTQPDAQTIAAYETAHYFAHADGPILLRVGDPAASHADWLQRTGARTATIMTAWNPFGEATAREQNDQAQAALLAAIGTADLRWVPASGQDPAGQWEPEPGFCVFDLPDEVLDDWLTRFRQNAAVQLTLRGGCRLVWHPSLR